MSSGSEQPAENGVFRLVVAEDAYLIREGIRSALEHEEQEVEVLEYCADLGSLLRAVDEHEPDVVITDIRMPPGHQTEGLAAAAVIRNQYPDIGVILLTQFANPQYAYEFLSLGA